MRAALTPTRSLSNPVPLVPFADWDYYYLSAPLQWRNDHGDNLPVELVDVPRGFVTDLASIPRIFWIILSPHARYSYPAILHDYLYWEQTCERAQADLIFKIAMREVGVKAAQIAAIYTAVRVAGSWAWVANKEARETGERRILRIFPDDLKMTWPDWRLQPDVFVP